MADIREPDQIPYKDLADRVHGSPQATVPFLGAGVPLSGRAVAEASAAEGTIDRSGNALVLAASRLTDPAARALLEWACNVARRIEGAGRARPDEGTDLLDRFAREPLPPSAGELAQLFADRAPFDPFKSLSDHVARRMPREVLPPEVTEIELVELIRSVFVAAGLEAPVGSLSSIAALYERGDNRAALLTNLRRILEGKRDPTLTHRLIARLAGRHVALQPPGAGLRAQSDYLIITTNYDRLMELALDAEGAPYVVLTTRRSDGKVIAVGANIEDELLRRHLERQPNEFPAGFVLEKSRPVVVLYKMHGSIGEGPLAEDSVVISDKDYVACLSWMARNERMIPAHVGEILRGRAFLFLGYSLNDWNVRSFFRGVIEKRLESLADGAPSERERFPDYAVLNRFSEFDRVFFQEQGVTILHTELGEFARKLMARLPADLRVAS